MALVFPSLDVETPVLGEKNFVTSSKVLINPQSQIACSGQQDREANKDC